MRSGPGASAHSRAQRCSRRLPDYAKAMQQYCQYVTNRGYLDSLRTSEITIEYAKNLGVCWGSLTKSIAVLRYATEVLHHARATIADQPDHSIYIVVDNSGSVKKLAQADVTAKLQEVEEQLGEAHLDAARSLVATPVGLQKHRGRRAVEPRQLRKARRWATIASKRKSKKTGFTVSGLPERSGFLHSSGRPFSRGLGMGTLEADPVPYAGTLEAEQYLMRCVEHFMSRQIPANADPDLYFGAKRTVALLPPQ